MARSMPMPVQRVEFRADHPFAFYLTYVPQQAVNVLFQGTMKTPV